MKIVKGILITLGAALAAVLLALAFSKKDYEVIRNVEIGRSNQEVFNYVKYLKNQDHYSKWARMDPEMKKEYKGEDGTVGFVSAWDSDNEDVGKGEQEIVGITDGERIDFELRFFEPFEATEPAYMATKALGNDRTEVEWGFFGHMPFPMNIMLWFGMEEAIGNDLSEGLAMLKETLEKMPVQPMDAEFSEDVEQPDNMESSEDNGAEASK